MVSNLKFVISTYGPNLMNMICSTGALGLKAAKVGAAGAGVAAALALKKKPQSVHTVHIQPSKHYGYSR